MSKLNELSQSRNAFLIGSVLWLPAGVLLTSLARFSDQMASPYWWASLLMATGSLIFVAPCGLPLAFACRRLSRHGYPRVAWSAMVSLGLVTVAATLIAGLLGPLGIAIAAAVLSAPVWIVAAIVGRKREPSTG